METEGGLREGGQKAPCLCLSLAETPWGRGDRTGCEWTVCISRGCLPPPRGRNLRLLDLQHQQGHSFLSLPDLLLLSVEGFSCPCHCWAPFPPLGPLGDITWCSSSQGGVGTEQCPARVVSLTSEVSCGLLTSGLR